jgi:hypothetical protein
MQKKAAVRSINWTIDTVALYNNIMSTSSSSADNKLIQVIVEHVRDGSTFR